MAEDGNHLFDMPSYSSSPERRLLLAVLERAILDFVGNDSRELDYASEWIFKSDSELEDGYPGKQDGGFSFDFVCSELDLDPKRIRRCIQAMPKRGHHRIAPWYFDKEWSAKVSKAGAAAMPSEAQFVSQLPDARDMRAAGGTDAPQRSVRRHDAPHIGSLELRRRLKVALAA
jgi:hypothetical protein